MGWKWFGGGGLPCPFVRLCGATLLLPPLPCGATCIASPCCISLLPPFILSSHCTAHGIASVPQIGDVLLNVDPGITPRFRQDLAVVSAPAKQCVMLSSVEMRLVCTPNLETLLEPMQPLPQWQRAEVVQAAAAGTDGLGGMPAAAGHLAAQRALVMESSEEDGAAEAMEVDGGAAAAAANGTQAHAQRQQQSNQQQQKQGKQAVGVAVKSEDEEEEVVSPRCGAMCLPRGGGASGGGGGGGGVVRSPLAGVFLPRGGQRAAEACGGIT